MNEQTTPSSQTRAPLPQSRTRKAFKIALYFIGFFIAEIGLLGAAASASSNKDFTNRLFGVALAIGIVAFIGSTIIFFRRRYHVYGLRWFRYLLWTLIATAGFIIAIALEYAIVPNPSDKFLPSGILGLILIFYGVALVWIACIKPPIRQLVDESTLSILQSLPAKQITLTELLERLQSEFHCSEGTLLQIINGLNYLEQIDIPGTSTRVCSMKGIMGKAVFPQVYGIVTHELRQSVVRALTMLNENEVDLGLFSLSRDFENTLKAYFIAASAKGIFQIPVKDPPERWKLAHMI